MREIYLAHFVVFPTLNCEVKIAEYALTSEAAVAAKQAEIRAAFPGDVARFEVRAPRCAS